MLFVSLSDAQRSALEHVSRHAVGRVAVGAQMVPLSDRGESLPAINRIYRCVQEMVRL